MSNDHRVPCIRVGCTHKMAEIDDAAGAPTTEAVQIS